MPSRIPDACCALLSSGAPTPGTSRRCGSGYRARMYAAQLGRFVGRDPIGYKGSSWNLHEYVKGGPVRRTDPSGKEEFPSPWYIIRHCLCHCGPRAIGIVGKDVSNEVEKIIMGIPWDPGSLDMLPGGDDDEYLVDPDPPFPEGKLRINPDSFAGTALRHCIAAGLIARLAGCDCSACAGYWREQWQMDVGVPPQGAADSNKASYNNEQGRLCAGCSGKGATVDPRYPDRRLPFLGPTLPMLPPLDYPSPSAVLNCCLNKLISGKL